MANKLPEEFDWKAFTPDDSPMTAPEAIESELHKKLAQADLKPDDVAYNFSSQIYDFSTGTEVVTGKEFDLLEVAQEKPVALIFGSYT